MGACEPCWNEAYRQSRLLGGSQVDHYRRLIEVIDGHPHAKSHPVTEYGTTRCPVEHVAAEIDADDGTCSACGETVLPPGARLRPAVPHGSDKHLHGDWLIDNDKCLHEECDLRTPPAPDTEESHD